MNKLRRRLVIASSLGALGTLSGCVTRALFEPYNYVEEVSAVLLSSNGKSLVVLTQNYHYVFDAPETIKATLFGSFHKYTEATFHQVYVDSSGKVTGEYELRLTKEAPEIEKRNAVASGFTQTKAGNVEYSGNLVGIRYGSGGIKPTHSSQKLNKTYKIYVVAEQSASEKAVKSLLTPITVAADGVLVIGAIPLFAVMVGYLSFICRNGKCK